MHHLVPPFIIDKFSRGDTTGAFDCASLFVDISGFTDLTEALMEHGQYGAEVLAVVMRSVFTPLIDSVYKQGGFITGFAGDAFTSVFLDGAGQSNPEHHALAAAQQMQRHMLNEARQETRFGVFDFSIKVGLATGQATWGILTSLDSNRATYYFSGRAIDDCALAEQHAAPGEIVCSNAFFDVVRDKVDAVRINDHWRLEQTGQALPDEQAIEAVLPNVDQAANFVPRFLVERSIEGEFRQIINLFIGLQGAPSHDELNTFVQHVFRLQKRFGGFLNRVDFGDKGCHLLFFWGAPLSHENDLVHMLDFVLALEQATDLSLRAGITYRIAHAGFIGSELAEEYTCYGRGVNLAARQMTAAGWGEIWLDGETARRASSDFKVDDLGLRSFKGFGEPQPVFQLTGRSAKRRSRFEDKPLIGRKQELQILREAIQPIFDGQFAGSVVITGEAGVGKSHLVETLYSHFLEQDQAAVYLCQADELLRQSLNPFRYFLTRYFNQSPSASDEVNKRRFGKKFDELVSDLPEPSLQVELERTRSFLGNLIGLTWKDSLYEQLDPELRFENTLEGLKALFKAESLRCPLIIHLEDAHWWDRDSQTFLTRLTRNVKNYPFVLLITSRQDAPQDVFEADVPLAHVQLQPLNQAFVVELAEDVIGHTPSQSLVSLLVERTEGNPFFVEQILLYLQEHNLLDAIEVGTQHTLRGDVHIPADARAVLTARLDRLPFEIKDLVQKASVLGQEFELPVLEVMVEGDPALESHLSAGETERVWLNSGPASFVFRHALLRDAAYGMQLGARLRRLHGRAAQAYEQVYPDPVRAPHFAEIAYHFDRAERKDPARQYYGSAGDFAKNEYRNEDAVTFFSRALELTDEEEYAARYQYLTARETVYQWMGHREGQEGDLKQLSKLLTASPNDLARADLALRKSSFDLITSGYEASIEHVREALVYARKIQDPLTEARSLHRWGRTLWQQGQSYESQNHLESALTIARSADDEQLIVECLVDLVSVHRLRGNYNRARHLLEEAIEAYEGMQDEQGLIRCYTLFGVIDTDLGNIAGSERYYLRALTLCRETGWRFAETQILVNLGGAQFELGNFTKGRDYLNRARILAMEIGDVRTQANSLDTLGLIAHYAGHLQDALTHFDQALTLLRAIDNKREVGFVLTHAGYTAIDMDLLDKAKIYLSQAMNVREDLGEAALRIDTLAGLARLALATGNVETAKSITTEILTHIEDNGIDGIELPVLVYLICAQVLLEAGKKDRAIYMRALRVLAAGNQLLEDRLQRLPDASIRERMMENLSYNKQLNDLWLAHHKRST